MKEKIMHYAKEILLFFVVMTIFANALSFYKSGDLNKMPFSLVNITLLNDSKYTIDKEQAILVHFWATWCPTCKVEASNIDTISKNYKVVTIAVKSGSNTEINDFMQENELSFKVVNDKSGFIANKFNIAAYPTTFIYDKDRNIVFSEVGYTSTWGLWLRMWWANL